MPKWKWSCYSQSRSWQEKCYHNIFLLHFPEPRTWFGFLRQMARLGFFPTTLCRGRGSNPRLVSRVAPCPGPFEGRSTDWPTAPRHHSKICAYIYLKIIHRKSLTAIGPSFPTTTTATTISTPTTKRTTATRTSTGSRKGSFPETRLQLKTCSHWLWVLTSRGLGGLASEGY